MYGKAGTVCNLAAALNDEAKGEATDYWVEGKAQKYGVSGFVVEQSPLFLSDPIVVVLSRARNGKDTLRRRAWRSMAIVVNESGGSGGGSGKLISDQTKRVFWNPRCYSVTVAFNIY